MYKPPITIAITLLTLLLLLLLVISSFIDIKEKRIPNWTVVLILMIGFYFSFLSNNEFWLRNSIDGIIIGMLFTLPIYALNGLGAGDVKLISAIGSFTGVDDVLLIIQITYAMNFSIALSLIMYSGDFRRMLSRFYKFYSGLSKGKLCYTKPESDDSANFELPLAPIISLSTLFTLYIRFFDELNLIEYLKFYK
jgi:prepilin peptidase CpaA